MVGFDNQKGLIINIALVLVSTLIMFGVSECAFRKILFSDNPAFEELRDPALYAKYIPHRNQDFLSDDYWKLNYLFRRNGFNVTKPDSLLGWTGFFHHNSYQHYDMKAVKDKKVVLIYGDSFTMCVDSTLCFQEILNADEAFSENHYMLNYGVGGYGTDQISILMALSRI